MVTIFVDKVIPTLAKMADNIGTNLKDPLNAVKDILSGFVIPAFKALYSYLTDFVVPFFANIFGPALTGLKNAFNTISTAITNNETDLKPLFTLFKSVATFVRDNMGPAIGTVLRVAFEVVGTAIGGVITAVSRLINFFDDVIDKIKAFIKLIKDNPLVEGLGNIIDNIFGGGRAAGGPVSAGTTYLVGERGPELFTPSGSGSIIPNHRLGGGGGGMNITVNGAIDPESVARQIITILNNSSYRGTLGAGALV
jgi:phage-related protein